MPVMLHRCRRGPGDWHLKVQWLPGESAEHPPEGPKTLGDHILRVWVEMRGLSIHSGEKRMMRVRLCLGRDRVGCGLCVDPQPSSDFGQTSLLGLDWVREGPAGAGIGPQAKGCTTCESNGSRGEVSGHLGCREERCGVIGGCEAPARVRAVWNSTGDEKGWRASR